MRPAWLLFGLLLIALVIAGVAQEVTQEVTQGVTQEAKKDQGSSPSSPPVTTISVPPPPPAEDPDAFRVSSDVELVLLDVSVKDADGGFVSGLKQSDFRVFENKVDQKITTFGAQDHPVTVGLIVDNSGSVRSKKPDIVTAALTFLKFSNPQDEVFVVNFNDRVIMGLPDDVQFSGDRNLLRQGLIMNPAQGRTALYDAVKTGLDHLEKGRLDKKTLVLISDGGDNMSTTTHDELIRYSEESLATIYTVGIYDSNDKDKNPGFLKHLARVTGGEAFFPLNSSHLVGICTKIAHDIRNRYTIGFVPSNREFDGKARKLRVEALAPDGKKYHVRTRTQYFASRSLSSRSRDGQR